MPTELTGYHVSAPVLCAEQLPNKRFLLKGIVRGTAFSIGGNYALTAGHVVKALQEEPDLVPVIGLYAPNGVFRTARIANMEELAGDIGVLELDYFIPESDKWLKPFPWSSRLLVGLEGVKTIGYAFGLEDSEGEKSIIARAFQGYVVAKRTRFRRPMTGEPPFPAYELTFAVPRGMSGSALLSASSPAKIHGLVIGNTESSMLVYKSKEVVTEERTTTQVEQYERLTLGIATQAPFVVDQDSKLLGTSIRAHLEAQELIVHDDGP